MSLIIKDKIRYTKAHKKTIRNLRPFPGGTWEKNTSTVKALKQHIRNVLTIFQENKCAYCTQPLDVTSGSEIEHIAPKGGAIYPKYTEFIFIPYNLVLSCHLCNSPVKKGRKDTIIKKEINYRNCTFNIVHPYFDDPTKHFDFTLSKNLTGIVYKPLTTKGKKSIEIFKLNNEAHIIARGERSILKHLKNQPGLYSDLLVKSISEYKPSLQ